MEIPEYRLYALINDRLFQVSAFTHISHALDAIGFNDDGRPKLTSIFGFDIDKLVIYEGAYKYAEFHITKTNKDDNSLTRDQAIKRILDIYGKKNLSRGNAALQSISIIAILFSIAIASFIFDIISLFKFALDK